ncbi:hypothetical protein LQE85_01525 [Stenotrophomonas rhizophila]|uniref:hypothetical protein n=1 Tax=Stenotrophomonas rhizophila TaxID=216778 RepID=UPI00201CC776|nr:hypothetical protein [Stenotrophomonas rhizophila]UQY87945.1 hypothetical protein LQE85_01525 [Stenotrophomonas rhizophila]
MTKRPMIAVWFSCGAASAVAAKLTIQRYAATHEIRVVNNPVVNEDPDNLRFARDVAVWLGVEIEQAINPKFPSCDAVEVWERERYMAGVAGAPCTRALKKRARQAWELVNKPDFHVLGFTAEERGRHERFVRGERENVLPVLIDAGLTKEDCAALLVGEGLALPAIYLRGYPNANCIGCVKSQSPTYWNHVRRHDPLIFIERAEQSRRLGARLVKVKGERIFLDQLKVTDKGGSLKSLSFDCGIFCEEPPQPGSAGTEARA